jgi:hypothetical protein
VWDVASGTAVARLEGHKGRIWSLAFSADGKRLASGSEDKTIRLWDVASGREIGRLGGHRSRIFSLAFSPDGRLLVSGSDDTVRLWDVADGESAVLEARRAYFEQAPAVESIYQASLRVLGYELVEQELKPAPRPLFLAAMGDYRFPESRRYWKLEQPRPPGKDPVEWMVEAMEASAR